MRLGNRLCNYSAEPNQGYLLDLSIDLLISVSNSNLWCGTVIRHA
jgi:hypothetical protein